MSIFKTSSFFKLEGIQGIGGATFLLRMQTIQQNSDTMVPPDTSMVCGADKKYIA